MPALDTDFERRNRYLYSPNWMKELPPSSKNSGARKLDGGHDLTEGVAGVPGVVIQERESQPSVRPGWVEFPLISLDVECEMKSSFRLPPFAGSMFRGVLGWALKEVCSPLDYEFLFESTSDLPGQSDSTRPFVLVPPLEMRNLRAGDRLRLTLNLFGAATDHRHSFVEALVTAGEFGLGAEQARFELTKVVCREGSSLWSCYQRNLGWGSAYWPLACGLKAFVPPRLAPTPRMVVDFLTPTRIVHQGQPVEVPPFHTLLRALYRRLDSLLQQQGQALDVDFRADIARAEQVEMVYDDLNWFDWQRSSQRQSRRHSMGGVVGSVVYEGPWLEHWWTLLSLARFLHLGKSTTFGMGKVQISPDDPQPKEE